MYHQCQILIRNQLAETQHISRNFFIKEFIFVDQITDF
jgi:hypothetical protein